MKIFFLIAVLLLATASGEQISYTSLHAGVGGYYEESFEMGFGGEISRQGEEATTIPLDGYYQESRTMVDGFDEIIASIDTMSQTNSGDAGYIEGPLYQPNEGLSPVDYAKDRTHYRIEHLPVSYVLRVDGYTDFFGRKMTKDSIEEVFRTINNQVGQEFFNPVLQESSSANIWDYEDGKNAIGYADLPDGVMATNRIWRGDGFESFDHQEAAIRGFNQDIIYSKRFMWTPNTAGYWQSSDGSFVSDTTERPLNMVTSHELGEWLAGHSANTGSTMYGTFPYWWQDANGKIEFDGWTDDLIWKAHAMNAHWGIA